MAEYGRLLLDCRILLLDCRLVVSLWLLSWWKQVDVYKVLRGCPVTLLDLNSLNLLVFINASFANNKDLLLQIGFIIILTNYN